MRRRSGPPLRGPGAASGEGTAGRLRSGQQRRQRRRRRRRHDASARAARRGEARWDERRVLAAALDGEAVASGQRHADNVAPALHGGFTIVLPGAADCVPEVARLETPAAWCVAVVTPAVRIDTRDARSALPADVPLRDAAANWACAAALVLALVRGDADLARRGLRDRVVEPVRYRRIPGGTDARDRALEAGAIGAGISGSGPTLFALASERGVAERAEAAMTEAFAERGIACAGRVSRLGAEGARSW